MPYHHLVLLSLKFGPSKRTVISFFSQSCPYNRSVIILGHQVHIFFAHFALLIRSVVILVKISKVIYLINNYSFIEKISICKNLTQQSNSQNQILFLTKEIFSLLCDQVERVCIITCLSADQIVKTLSL